MSREKFKELPLIYSCSGCSNIAQLANQVAVELDREHIAEMSCIAGIGGGVASILKKAKCGRKIIALDGCSLHCVKNNFLQHNINPNYHYTLTEYGIKKRYHMNFLPSDVNKIKTIVKTDLNLIREG
jgi:uncharacterized metal-binding protein